MVYNGCLKEHWSFRKHTKHTIIDYEMKACALSTISYVQEFLINQLIQFTKLVWMIHSQITSYLLITWRTNQVEQCWMSQLSMNNHFNFGLYCCLCNHRATLTYLEFKAHGPLLWSFCISFVFCHLKHVFQSVPIAIFKIFIYVFHLIFLFYLNYASF